MRNYFNLYINSIHHSTIRVYQNHAKWDVCIKRKFLKYQYTKAICSSFKKYISRIQITYLILNLSEWSLSFCFIYLLVSVIIKKPLQSKFQYTCINNDDTKKMILHAFPNLKLNLRSSTFIKEKYENTWKM